MSPNNSSTNSQSQGLALLEEWPRRESLTPDSKELKLLSDTKQVTFSPHSTMRLYKCASADRSKKSYTSADRRSFRAEAAQDGLRIQDLVSSCPGNTKTPHAIQHLMKNGVLSREELVGIEHYIAKDGPVRLMYERRAHAAVVLKAQKQLLGSEDIGDKLARVSAASSSKSLQKAGLRAALCLSSRSETSKF